jgi:hypothetical protein
MTVSKAFGASVRWQSSIMALEKMQSAILLDMECRLVCCMFPLKIHQQGEF